MFGRFDAGEDRFDHGGCFYRAQDLHGAPAVAAFEDIFSKDAGHELLPFEVARAACGAAMLAVRGQVWRCGDDDVWSEAGI